MIQTGKGRSACATVCSTKSIVRRRGRLRSTVNIYDLKQPQARVPVRQAQGRLCATVEILVVFASFSSLGRLWHGDDLSWVLPWLHWAGIGKTLFHDFADGGCF